MNYKLYYDNAIKRTLEEIDITLKSHDNISIKETSELLHIEEKEIENIIDNIGINRINSDNFLKIMEHGNSYICNLYKREIECNSPFIYMPETVSYIYDLDIEDVKYAFKINNIIQATNYTLPEIFKDIVIEKNVVKYSF